jgi:hypothetical protein
MTERILPGCLGSMPAAELITAPHQRDSFFTISNQAGIGF